MKNKIFQRVIYASLVVLLSTTNFAYAAFQATPQLQAMIVKFSIVMLVLVGFFLVLSICLALYNRCFIDARYKVEYQNDLSLKSPEDKEQAVLGYIVRNRLK